MGGGEKGSKQRGAMFTGGVQGSLYVLWMKESFFPSEEGLWLCVSRQHRPYAAQQRLLSESRGGRVQWSVETRHQDGEKQL